MPAFANPFQGNVNRRLSKKELVQVLRLDIAGELEAIYLYDTHIQITGTEIAKEVLANIRDEERARIDELMTLLRTLNPQGAELFVPGEAEVCEVLSELRIAASEDKSDPGFSAPAAVGSPLNEP